MDFREHQDRAKANSTKIWIAYILLLVLASSITSLTLTTAYNLSWIMYDPQLMFLSFAMQMKVAFLVNFENAELMTTQAYVFGIVMAIIVGFTSYGFFRSSNGHKVAQAFGGYIVSEDVEYDLSEKEKMALNIVHEISLAANITPPTLYVVPDDAINAFAAGKKPGEQVVAVTTGALNAFNRDELSGVIAHEIGHITNQDIDLNIKVSGFVFGFTAIYFLAKLAYYSGIGRNRDSRGNWILLVVAAILAVVGMLSVFAGKILQAMMSRQREFLADASAVQYTRQPDGLKSAFNVIQNGGHRTKIDSPETADYAHAFIFGTGNLLATHPPMDERINRLSRNPG